MSTRLANVVDHDGHAATYVDWLKAIDLIALGRFGGTLRAPDSGSVSFTAWSEGATPLEGFRRIHAALPVGQPMLADPRDADGGERDTASPGAVAPVAVERGTTGTPVS